MEALLAFIGYHANADVYLNHAWRNPEADLLSEFICGLVGKGVYT